MWQNSYNFIAFFLTSNHLERQRFLKVHDFYIRLCMHIILAYNRLGCVYRRTRATQWAIADGLRMVPKDGPEA